MSELIKLLTSVDAKEAIAEVAEFTVQEGKEAGFAVYKTPGEFIVSRVVRGARDYIDDGDELGANVWEDFGESTGPIGALGETYNTICLDNITCLPESNSEEDEPGEYLTDEEIASMWRARKPRRDLALVLHSHPAHPAHGKKPSDLLRPSIPDLEIDERVSNYNPDCVHAILVAEEKLALASILLYRRGNDFRPFYQALDIEPPAPRMVSLMEQNGFKTAIVQFRFRKKTWKQPALATFRNF